VPHKETAKGVLIYKDMTNTKYQNKFQGSKTVLFANKIQ